ncbi:MAG: FtsX-like permease family protein [Pirellulaceae bacterium]
MSATHEHCELASDITVDFLRLAIRGLLYHWKINAAVALGVAAATAVLTGALLVGDSVRGSLRNMTIDRLGLIDELLLVDRFFRESLAEELERDPHFPPEYHHAVGVMVFPAATVERRTTDRTTRASNVLVVGSPTTEDVADGRSFWSLAAGDAGLPARCPGRDEIVLNRTLAEELQAVVGDRITVRLPKPADIPADSPLGEKADRIRSFPRLKIIEIIETQGLARFSLTPSQALPANAFVSLEQLQEGLEQPERVNAIFIAGQSHDQAAGPAASQALASALHPTLDDLGLTLQHVQLAYTDPQSQQSQSIYDYFSLSSQRMVLPPEIEMAARNAFDHAGGQPVFTYLANLLEPISDEGTVSAERRIPYSTIAAIDPSPTFHLESIDGQKIPPPGPNEIILTDWAADDLEISVGDAIRLTFFEPETTHGTSVETQQVLKVVAITPLTPPSAPYLPSRQLQFTQRPTIANDPALTPEVKGITDQKSIDDWEVPFTIDYGLIRPEDDRYWEEYGTTPKAFVSLATGQRLWGSRFGQSTSYRIPAREGLTEESVRNQLLERLTSAGARLGFDFQPIKRRQLLASSGNTPFDVLFLLLSFFIIAAALLLVALLFRLGFEQRARQAGLLLAVGWRPRRVRRLLVAEGLGISAAGSGMGVLVGLGYAMLILAALRSKSWWLGAVTTPFLEFHATPRSLLIGGLAGIVVSELTIIWNVFQTRHIPARRLLAGQVSAVGSWVARPARWPLIVAGILLVTAVAFSISAVYLSGQQQAGFFVGAGASMLAAILLALWQTLRSGGSRVAGITGSLPLLRLAVRSAARNPGRSTLTIALIATASFLIVAMSAFQLQPTETGTGGFTLLGESSQPIYADLESRAGRDELIGGQASQLTDVRVCSFRVRPGDDASCGNLYRASQPRILGVPPAFIERFDDTSSGAFQFTQTAALSESQRHNPWQLLASGPTPRGEPIPVVIDQETAMYSLRLYGGIGEEFTFDYDGRPLTFRVAGLLSLSILHGNLLISEADFRRQFPTLSGYRYFLIETPAGASARVADVLENALGDQGFDAKDSYHILAGLMMLQNTYLRTFQSLGALGLLLGTFGLAAVQMRNVLERRGEMGLLRASGFRRRRLSLLVLLENLMLLLAGLAAGVAAALLAILPHLFGGEAALPFQDLAVMLLVVLLVGIIAGVWAARATMRVPLLAALREER